MAGLELFGGGNDSDNENEDVAEIKINEEYARRYEHNKNREDLQRFEELKKRGLVDDDDADSEEDDDDDDEDDDIFANSNKQDLEFVNAIIKVKNRDPILKNKEVQLFQSDETDKSRVRNDRMTSKRTFLKDLVAQHLIQDGPELKEEEEEDIPIQSYNEEQEQIRREFLDAAAAAEDDDGGDGEFLRLKDKDVAEKQEDNAEFEKKLDEYFGDDLDDNARFLRNFFKNKMWMEKEGQADLREEDLEMVSEDEKEIEKQEEYEYRFQENAGDRVLGHSREIEGSVRKKVKARKEQRKSKEERMETARLEREEELRHLKNLKRKENDEKIKKIMEIAGIKDGEESLFNSKELEDEFNPHEYDRMMKKVFGEDYYEAVDDADFYRDMDVEEDEKPNFDKEDELLGLPKDWESVGSGDGFLAAREKILKLKKSDGDYEKEEEQEEGEEGDEEDEEEEEKVSEEVKQEKKRKLALLERAKKEMMDEYYKLDYEDTIGDLRTRFKYAKIKPNRYGLSTAEILMVDEKELNQYVPLKKLAPFKETEWKVPNSKRNEIKRRVKEISRQGKMGFKKNRKRLRTEEDAKHSNSSIGAAEHEKEQVGDSNGDKSKLSRNARRRRHQTERKLPISRLMAYGVMPLESKKKAKH